ncbi:MAG: hypothetical protein IJP13_08505 [Lachnospiraceae bacterium]|nr:hypothetical protein [Lachnospiraceae bacterium]
MYICRDCNSEFEQPNETNIDTGVHYDTGIIGKHKVPTIKLCPICRSTNYENAVQEVAC